MPTKRELVGSAFSEIGIGNWEFDLQPDEIQDAVRRLDAMMAAWSAKGVRIGYNGTSDDPDTESGVPDVSIEAIRTNLAVRIAPAFNKTLSQDTRSAAVASYSDLVALTMTVPQRQYPNTLPLGAGNRLYGGAGWVNFYPGGTSEDC